MRDQINIYQENQHIQKMMIFWHTQLKREMHTKHRLKLVKKPTHTLMECHTKNSE